MFTEEKVFSYIEKNDMVKSNDKVIAGVSGGADSVCLLFVLLAYREKIPFDLAVVHVNHGIRPEAGEDQAYVEELCRKEQIPFYPVYKDVPGMAKELRCSEEETGRRARYEAFGQIAEQIGAHTIAVAHNQNDRSETMLFHLFRGSGIKGLAGIRPVRILDEGMPGKGKGIGRGIKIIRPILCLERDEIEGYLKKRKIAFCEDATNREDKYTRNRIRHKILPVAEREISQGCVEHMSHTADLLLEAEDYLENRTLVEMEKCVKKTGEGFRVDIDGLAALHPLMKKRILNWILNQLSPGGRDIAYIHVELALELFEQQGNRMICLPFGLTGRREYKWVYFCGKPEDHGKKRKEEKKIQSFPFMDKEWGLSFQILDRSGTKNENGDEIREIPQKKYTKWFDYDKIIGDLVVRCRKTGDYITVSDGKRGEMKKSLKDYFINEKIPAKERDAIRLLADGQHIIWAVGYRISEHYKVTAATQRILEVKAEGLEEASAQGSIQLKQSSFGLRQ